MTVNNRDVGGRAQRTKVSLLSVWLLRVVRTSSHRCGKTFDSDNVVPGEHAMTEGRQVEPAIWRTLYGTVIKVESVNIDVGFWHGFSGIYRGLTPLRHRDSFGCFLRNQTI